MRLGFFGHAVGVLCLLVATVAAQATDQTFHVRLTTTSASSSADVPLAKFVPIDGRPGLDAVYRAFTPLRTTTGEHEGDAFLFFYDGPGDDNAVEVVIANGCLTNYLGRLQGQAVLNVGGLQTEKTVDLHDGTGAVLRFGLLGYHPEPDWPAWYLRCGPKTYPDKLLARFRTLPDGGPTPDNPNTGITGSPRNIVGAWEMGVATIVLSQRGETIPPSYFQWMADWTDQQFNRPTLYYAEDGSLWRALDNPDAIIGDKGFSNLYSAKNLYGRPKTGSTSTWRSFDHQHFETERLVCIERLTGSKAAQMAAEGEIEAAISYPGLRAPMPQPGDGNQRWLAWPTRNIAFAYQAWGPSHPQYVKVLTNVFTDVRLSQGTAGPWFWTTLAKAKADHMYPTLADAKAYFVVKNWPWDATWTKPDHITAFLQTRAKADGRASGAYIEEFFDSFRGVAVWQQALLSYALGAAREALGPQAPADAGDLHRGAFLALMICGTQAGVDQDTGQLGVPKTLWTDYAPLVGRVNKPPSWGNGTIAWDSIALAQALRMFPKYKPQTLTLLTKLVLAGDYYSVSQKETQAVSTYFETLPVLGVTP